MEELVLKADKTLDPVFGINIRKHVFFSAAWGAHSHDFMEIFIILKGTILHLVNNKKLKLSEGDIVLIRPGDRHCYRYFRNRKCELMNLAFSLEMFRKTQGFIKPEYSLDRIFDSELPPAKRLSRTEMRGLVTRLMKSSENSLNDPGSGKISFKLIIAEMLCLFKDEKKSRIKKEIPEWVLKAVDGMQRRENLKEGLPALRKIACRSDEHISRSFKNYLDKTPTDFINESRIKYAASRLLNTDDKIDFIAMESGFPNISHFYHVFKGGFGISPKKYRRLNSRNTINI